MPRSFTQQDEKADHIRKVRDANPIDGLVTETVPLKRSGSSYMGDCPFHNDTDPSLSVSSEKGLYNCFGCGEHGDAISWVMKRHGLTFWEAVLFLAHRAGIDLPNLTPERKAEMERQRTREETMGVAATYYHNQLSDETRARIRSERNFTDETINRFMLGEAKGGLWPHLQSKEISEDDAIAAGVVKRTNDGKIRDYFWNRLIIPNFVRGRCVHVTGRSLTDALPKYLHISGPKTHLFNEDELKSETVIICEGPMDVIALEQAGFPAVGLMGLSIKPEHVKRFSR